MPCPTGSVWFVDWRRREYVRRGGVGVLLEEVVFDYPGGIDAEPVGEFDLLEGLLEQPVLVVGRPRPRQIVLDEYSELHGSSPIAATTRKPGQVEVVRDD